MIFQKQSFLKIVIILLGSTAFGGGKTSLPVSVNSITSGDSSTSAPATGLVSRSGQSTMLIKIHNSCFGTNLRQQGNPLAPSSIIQAHLTLNINGKNHALSISYPAEIVTPQGMTSKGDIKEIDSKKYKGITSAALYGNTVILRTNIPSTASVSASGVATIQKTSEVSIVSEDFSQVVTKCGGAGIYGAYGHSSYTPTYACSDFMGKNGPLDHQPISIIPASDLSQIDINISFPGQTGFCGGYWSPLMVFFDEQRPHFDNISDFPLNPMKKTYWPEAKSPGWFVALDRDHSGKIDKKDQLFGETSVFENGFDALKALDSNKDGFIDSKDKDFKNLVLWNDKNGDGISQKEEMIKLSKKIIKISLDYKKGSVETFGKFAEAREKSKFWFKEKGKVKTGDIIDIWFSPVETSLGQK